jgi:general secretion pathway protein H
MKYYHTPYQSWVGGFTLLELLVVMAIISMMAALVIPQVSSGQMTLLKAQVREAVAVLNYARRAAIVEGEPKTASFYESKETTATQSASKIEPGRWVSRGATLQWGNELKEQDKVTRKITFYPEGGSSGGEFIINYQEHKAKITVNPLTGKVQSSLVDIDEQPQARDSELQE